MNTIRVSDGWDPDHSVSPDLIWVQTVCKGYKINWMTIQGRSTAIKMKFLGLMCVYISQYCNLMGFKTVCSLVKHFKKDKYFILPKICGALWHLTIYINNREFPWGNFLILQPVLLLYCICKSNSEIAWKWRCISQQRTWPACVNAQAGQDLCCSSDDKHYHQNWWGHIIGRHYVQLWGSTVQSPLIPFCLPWLMSAHKWKQNGVISEIPFIL